MINIPCNLDKHRGGKKILSLSSAYVRNVDSRIGGCITARYYKGIAGDGDNVVIVIDKKARGDNNELLYGRE